MSDKENLAQRASNYAHNRRRVANDEEAYCANMLTAFGVSAEISNGTVLIGVRELAAILSNVDGLEELLPSMMALEVALSVESKKTADNYFELNNYERQLLAEGKNKGYQGGNSNKLKALKAYRERTKSSLSESINVLKSYLGDEW